MQREPAGRSPVAGGGDKDGNGVLGGFGLEGGEAGEGLRDEGGREEGEGEMRGRSNEAKQGVLLGYLPSNN